MNKRDFEISKRQNELWTCKVTDSYGNVGETTKIINTKDIIKFNQTVLNVIKFNQMLSKLYQI